MKDYSTKSDITKLWTKGKENQLKEDSYYQSNLR